MKQTGARNIAAGRPRTRGNRCYDAAVLLEFRAETVAMGVLEHLERRRQSLVADPAELDAEVRTALEPVRRSYREAELPPVYLKALEDEIAQTIPARWQALAGPFTDDERRGFGLWRGGDPIARLCYVALGFVIGGILVRAPFIPLWEKAIPFALAIAAWWLPDLQTRSRKRRYARALGDIVRALAGAQKALDQQITINDLLPPGESS